MKVLYMLETLICSKGLQLYLWIIWPKLINCICYWFADVPDRFSNSPLHWATKEDNQPILLALIKGGANVNAKGYVGKTPLHIAVSEGCVYGTVNY